VTVEALTTVQAPKLAAHVPGSATKPGGNANVTAPVCARAAVFAIEVVISTTLPGPVQDRVSRTAICGLGTKLVSETVKEQVEVLFDASVAVQLTVVTPTGKVECEQTPAFCADLTRAIDKAE
jgi:hypothetical protein